jgi:hypothetical protein
MALQSAFAFNANEIFGSLANMIISQDVFADNIGKHQTLVDKARVDGTLYGDTKLYYATDVLKSKPWGNDSEATNLLALHRPQDPAVQSIIIDNFRQVSLTVDNYLTKRAFADEYAFSQFNSVMLAWISTTKKIYDGTLYNVFIGTTKSTTGKQARTVDLTTAISNASTQEEANRLEAEAIAQNIADLLVEMGDYNRDFNDYGYLRSYGEDGIKVIWNSKYINKIKKIDLPTMFHKDGLIDKFDQDILASRYFGRAVAAGDKGSGKVIGSDGTYDNTKGTLRAKVEKDISSGSGTASAGTAAQHVFPGDLIPNGVTVKSGGDFEENEVYVEDADVICKVLVKLPPFMSAFETGTSFFNPKSLTENHYLTFGHNTLAYLKNYPFITISKV